ncbi:MAG: hypothetical protein V2G41_09400 [bacterium JZ-2024 1]
MATKETIELLKFIVSLANGIGKAAADGKFDASDLAFFFQSFTMAGPALVGASSIGEELASMSEGERNELLNYFRTNFDIPQEALENVIEAGFEAALSIHKLILAIKSYG